MAMQAEVEIQVGIGFEQATCSDLPGRASVAWGQLPRPGPMMGLAAKRSGQRTSSRGRVVGFLKGKRHAAQQAPRNKNARQLALTGVSNGAG